MGKQLVVVESPAKARTLAGFLGAKYVVKSSVGHVRDLPKSRLGVDVSNDFAPTYQIPKEKKKVVDELRMAVQKASTLYLATDPDREGEAISWHLTEALGIGGGAIPIHRVVFHEITKEAVAKAFAHPRAIDMQLVNAQQARRIIDRLVGYKISPLLWRKVQSRLSAGRVQSVAVRLIVEREREIQGFAPQEYWTIEAELEKKQGDFPPFRATLLRQLRDKADMKIGSQGEAEKLTADLERAFYDVHAVRQKDIRRQPPPPFITSTLQQDAWHRLGFSAKRTISIAQQLYEGLPLGTEGTLGLITYMRTDSTTVATSARDEVRAYIARTYGADFVPSAPRVFKSKVRGAQEAHEAIRPTSVGREPGRMKAYLTADQLKLYDLIWRRMVASQMAAAVMENTSVDIRAQKCLSGAEYLLRATGTVIKFPGFTLLYVVREDEEDEQKRLPPLAKGEALELRRLIPEQHFTKPPPRYSEATLVKALEERGIGRPSTYAPILSTIQDRGYVSQEEKRLYPTGLGTIVNDILVEHFAQIADVGFTAQMEEELDEIAAGEREWIPVVSQLYEPLETMLETAQEKVEKVRLPDETTDESCELCGKPMVIKRGRYGQFVSCSGYPECKNSRPLQRKVGVQCPRCGGEIVERTTKKRRVFYGCSNYPRCVFASWGKPLSVPCPDCGGMMIAAGSQKGRCSACGKSVGLKELEKVKVGV
ncbi:MAG: type I DNA topoisomerase [Chloroflexi bacterium]|nr:type I DNA topoisomerase [Chloroflexota bacterium]